MSHDFEQVIGIDEVRLQTAI